MPGCSQWILGAQGVTKGRAALATAGIASAGPMAQPFFEMISSQGIIYPDARLADVDGQLVCSRIWNGESPNGITAQLDADTGLTKQQATYCVVASVTYYCGDEAESFTQYVD